MEEIIKKDENNGKKLISHEDKIEKRKEKIKNWLKNPYNLTFLGIMIFAFVIRLYYFFLTKNQPLWWDEADYMAYAKNLAGYNVNWIVTSQHNSIFPFLVAFFFKLSFSEEIIKFILEIVPSILLVFLTYKICILMYDDRKIAVISTFLMATFWEILFNSMRFHLDVPALLFGFFAVYIFFQGYEKKEKIFGKIKNVWAIPLTVFFIILTYSMRRGYFLFVILFLLYMLFTKKFKFLVLDKYNWLALFIILILFFIVEKFIFIYPITEVSQLYRRTDIPFNLFPFKVFSIYFKPLDNSWIAPLFYLFFFGLFLIISNLVLSIGYFKKNEDSKIKSDLFVFLMIFVTLAYFLFYQRSTAMDPRWYFPILLGSFICISKGAIFITDHIKKYNKFVSLAILILLIGYGGYYELQHANFIIETKINSFNGIKQVSLYLKQISNLDDIIMSVPIPQAAYYAERKVIEPWRFLNKKSNQETSLEEFLSKLKENKNLRYVIITFSEPNHPEWMRQDTYTQDGRYAKWKIPFVDTEIDFTTGKQDIKQEKTYDNITFKLLIIKDDAFVYEIVRS